MTGALALPLAAGLALLSTAAVLFAARPGQGRAWREFLADGGGALVTVYAVWFLLWKAGAGPEPHHLVLFAVFYAGAVLGYGMRLFASSYPIPKD